MKQNIFQIRQWLKKPVQHLNRSGGPLDLEELYIFIFKWRYILRLKLLDCIFTYIECIQEYNKI